MMFHLLTLDSMQHRYGPGTLAATSTMAHLDSQVAPIVKAVDDAGLAPRTTFFIVSPHGFKRVKWGDQPERCAGEARPRPGDGRGRSRGGGLGDARRRIGHRLPHRAGPGRLAALKLEGGVSPASKASTR